MVPVGRYFALGIFHNVYRLISPMYQDDEQYGILIGVLNSWYWIISSLKLTETHSSIKILDDVKKSLFGWMVNENYYRD